MCVIEFIVEAADFSLLLLARLEFHVDATIERSSGAFRQLAFASGDCEGCGIFQY
jgi:hypothetical protein